jgi:heat shock protein HspQ
VVQPALVVGRNRRNQTLLLENESRLELPLTAPSSFALIVRKESGGQGIVMSTVRSARFQIGQVVRHRVYPFRGVIFDVDPTFSNTEEWYRSIPQEVRPNKDQPFYHLLAENADTEYVAYVSEQNLVPDPSDEPLRHPQVAELFEDLKNGIFRFRFLQEH